MQPFDSPVMKILCGLIKPQLDSRSQLFGELSVLVRLHRMQLNYFYCMFRVKKYKRPLMHFV